MTISLFSFSLVRNATRFGISGAENCREVICVFDDRKKNDYFAKKKKINVFLSKTTVKKKVTVCKR